MFSITVVCVYFIILSAVVDTATCSAATTMYSSVQAKDVSPTSFGTFNFRELEEIVYDIEILKVPVSEPGDHEDLEAVHEEGDGGVERMEEGKNQESNVETKKSDDDAKASHLEDMQHMTLLSKHRQKYLCTLPQQVLGADSAVDVDGSETRTKDQFINVSALLQPLTQEACLSKNTGWWTYEYCHGDYIRQYHSEAAKTVKNLWIGYYQNETVWDQEEINKAKERIESLRNKLSAFQIYHSISYVNGTTCDLTGNPRRATAKITCSITGKDRLVSVEEMETCDYVLHIETPLLCKESLFDVASMKKPHNLSCSPVVSREEYQRFKELQERLKIEEEQQLKEERERTAARKAKRKEKLYETLTSDKLKAKSALFDSGDEDDNGEFTEVTDEVKQVTGNEREGEKLQEAAEKLDEDFLDSFMDNLNKQLLKLTKKDSFFYKALEHAIENVQETVDEAKQIVKAKRSSKKATSKSVDAKEKVKLSEDSLSQEKAQTEDGDLNSDEEHKEKHSDGSSVTEETAVIEDEEEEEESSQTLEGVLKMLLEKNKAALAKKLEGSDMPRDSNDGAIDEEDDIKVKVEGDEDIEEEELDETSLTELGEEITGELQKKLKDAGLGDGAEVRVKFFSLPPEMLDDLLEEVGEEDEEEGDYTEDKAVSLEEEEEAGKEKELDAYRNPKQPAESSSLSGDYPAGSSVGVSSHGSGSTSKKSQSKKKGTKDDGVKVYTIKLDSLLQLSGAEDDDGEESSGGGEKSSSGNIFSKILDHIMNPMTEERKKVQELEKNYEQVWHAIDEDEAEKRKGT